MFNTSLLTHSPNWPDFCRPIKNFNVKFILNTCICYIHPCSFALIYQFDLGQKRETGADLDPNDFHGVIFFVFPKVVSLSDLANIVDPDQVLRRAALVLLDSELSLFCKLDKII